MVDAGEQLDEASVPPVELDPLTEGETQYEVVLLAGSGQVLRTQHVFYCKRGPGTEFRAVSGAVYG